MKLHPITIIMIGLAIGLIALSYAVFQQLIPNLRIAQQQREYQAALEVEANKQRQAEQRRQDAIDEVNRIATEWQAVVRAKTPPQSLAQGGIDLSVNRWQLTVDAQQFQRNIQRAVNAQMRKGGVTVIAGPQVPFPSESASNIVESFFNYPTVEYPVVIFELGTVTVQGTLDQIRNHVLAWSSMPNYMAVTNGLALNGTSPELTATYELAIVGFIRGKEISPPVPEGAGGGGFGARGPGGPGGFGGFGGPGGIPGMPPGMPPGVGGMPPSAMAGAGARTGGAAAPMRGPAGGR